MFEFEVGTLLIGKDEYYSYTNNESLMVVTKKYDNDNISIKVRIIASTNNYSLGDRYDVVQDKFEPISLREYFERFPNAYKYANFNDILEAFHVDTSDETTERIRQQIKENEKHLRKKEEEKRRKRLANAYHLSDEERKNLRDEIIALLKTYDYHPTDKGVDAILDEWSINKASLIRLFQNHPNYNGKYQIAFDTDFEREIDKDKANEFYKWVLETYLKNHDYVIDDIPYRVARKKCESCTDICDCIRQIMQNLNEENYELVVIDGHTFSFFTNEHKKYNNILNKYYSKNVHSVHGYILIGLDYNEYNKLNDIYRFTSYNSPFINENFAAMINERFPIKAVAGQKLSRVINKLCHYLEIDKDKDYNKEFAKFSDAVNPLTIKRHTIISVHPVDYFTMSFGNSWSSCHTIDKENIRDMDNSYEGMYSGGTMSYMLDKTSVVFYTVDEKYDGNELELEPKINRNMFHIGEDKIVQGRVYPQSNDEKNSIYEQFRNIMQKVIADCMNKPNMWKLKKGTDACLDVINSEGVHYKDYENFDDCNVSYLKLDDDTYNENSITVGHEQICPCCGKVHTRENCIECNDCY